MRGDVLVARGTQPIAGAGARLGFDWIGSHLDIKLIRFGIEEKNTAPVGYQKIAGRKQSSFGEHRPCSSAPQGDVWHRVCAIIRRIPAVNIDSARCQSYSPVIIAIVIDLNCITMKQQLLRSGFSVSDYHNDRSLNMPSSSEDGRLSYTPVRRCQTKICRGNLS